MENLKKSNWLGMLMVMSRWLILISALFMHTIFVVMKYEGNTDILWRLYNGSLYVQMIGFCMYVLGLLTGHEETGKLFKIPQLPNTVLRMTCLFLLLVPMLLRAGLINASFFNWHEVPGWFIVLFVGSKQKENT